MVRTIALFFTLMFLIGTDTFLISPLLPTLRDLFGVSVDHSGWMVGAYALGYALFALIAGPLSDQWNRKKVIIWGLIAFSLSTFLCGFAQGFWSMILFRFFAGISAAFVAPQVWALIPILVPATNIMKAFGFATAGLSVAQLLGVPIGSYLASVQWSLPFWIVGLVSLFLTLFVHLWIPHQEKTSQISISIKDRYQHLLSKPNATFTFIAYFFFHFANFASFSFIGTFLSSSFQLDLAQIGSAMMFFGAGNLIGSLLSGKISSKWGSSFFKFSMLILIAIYFILSFLTNLQAVELCFFVIFFIGGAIFPILMGRIQSLAPDARGTSASLANSLMYGAATLGSSVAGVLFAHFHGFYMVSLFSAANFAISLLLFTAANPFSKASRKKARAGV